jgi:drug/metabolite transporter (DMT)-like permease
VVILGETFTIYHAVALTLVLGGIWIAESGRARLD